MSHGKWTSVEEGLPIVPDNKYAIEVIVVENDEMYAESCNCDGRSVRCKMFDKETQDFEEYIHGLDEWVSTDPVSHWMYMPILPIEEKEHETCI